MIALIVIVIGFTIYLTIVISIHKLDFSKPLFGSFGEHETKDKSNKLYYYFIFGGLALAYTFLFGMCLFLKFAKQYDRKRDWYQILMLAASVVIVGFYIFMCIMIIVNKLNMNKPMSGSSGEDDSYDNEPKSYYYFAIILGMGFGLLSIIVCGYLYFFGLKKEVKIYAGFSENTKTCLKVKPRLCRTDFGKGKTEKKLFEQCEMKQKQPITVLSSVKL